MYKYIFFCCYFRCQRKHCVHAKRCWQLRWWTSTLLSTCLRLTQLSGHIIGPFANAPLITLSPHENKPIRLPRKKTSTTANRNALANTTQRIKNANQNMRMFCSKRPHIWICAYMRDGGAKKKDTILIRGLQYLYDGALCTIWAKICIHIWSISCCLRVLQKITNNE